MCIGEAELQSFVAPGFSLFIVFCLSSHHSWWLKSGMRPSRQYLKGRFDPEVTTCGKPHGGEMKKALKE